MLHVFFLFINNLKSAFSILHPVRILLFLVLPHHGGAIFDFDSRVFEKKNFIEKSQKLQLFGCGATNLCNKKWLIVKGPLNWHIFTAHQIVLEGLSCGIFVISQELRILWVKKSKTSGNLDNSFYSRIFL